MDFEELLMEAIDEGLSLLGESAKQAVYFYLEKTFKMNRLDIPYKIEEFTDEVEKIFGSGAKIVGLLKDFHFTSMHEQIKPFLFFVNDYSFLWVVTKIKSND